jgi:hypothetical protein
MNSIFLAPKEVHADEKEEGSESHPCVYYEAVHGFSSFDDTKKRIGQTEHVCNLKGL